MPSATPSDPTSAAPVGCGRCGADADLQMVLVADETLGLCAPCAQASYGPASDGLPVTAAYTAIPSSSDPTCECPGCRVELRPDQRWFCDVCRYDVGPGCACGFLPEWSR